MTVQVDPIPAARPLAGQKMTYEEFLQADFPHNHFEWVDGRAVEMSAVEYAHAELVSWLVQVFANYLERTGGGKALAEPFQMRLTKGARSGRSPDVLVVLPQNLHRIQRLYLDGPADLVVEVVSASSRTVDRHDKFQEYEAAGVPEYWIVDPLAKRAEFFRLEGGSFVPGDLDDAGVFASSILKGVTVDPNWLWTMPPTTEILPRWGIM